MQSILSHEDQEDLDNLIVLFNMIIEFIIFGFNRVSDIEKGRYRVVPSEKHPWLIWAVMMKTSFESHNITLERLRNIFKVKKYKGKTIDFEKILIEEPMSRLHRRMVANGKAVGLKLKNDRVIIEAARRWYQCRVAHTSINKYCEAQSYKGVNIDPKNIERQIRPCDDAVGYMSKLPRKNT